MKPAETAQADVDNVHGTWTVLSAEADGRPIPKDAGYPYLGGRIVFDKRAGDVTKPNPTHGTFRFRENAEADYRLVTSGTPKVIEFDISAGVSKNIYRLEGDRLWLCLQIDGAPAETPTGFTTKKGDGRLSLVLARRPEPTDDKKAPDREKP